MKFNNFMKILATAILLCGSCSSETTSGTEPNPPTPVDPPKTYTDPEIVEMVQKDALKYFWDYAQSNSKLARERYHTDNPGQDAHVVSTGGSGFGLMTILVGIKNGYVTRTDAVSRLSTALNFLQNANRFHGAWPHWMDGNTGNVIPFSTKDNGGDLVETAFLAQGLICVIFQKFVRCYRVSHFKKSRRFMERNRVELVYSRSKRFVLALVT